MMKLRLGQFTIWYLIFYFLIEGAVSDLILFGETEVFYIFDSIFWPTSMGSFYLFSLLAYISFYFFYQKKQWVWLLLGIFVAMVFPIVFRYAIEQVLYLHIFGETNYPSPVSSIHYIRDNYRFGFRFISFGIIFYFYRYGQHKKQIEHELKIENQSIQLDMLRSQINPHFLLNSLNSIYSLVYHESPKSLEALERLTTMLKYSLYTNQEFVTIEEEMEIIRAYIDLHAIRFAQKSQPNINISDSTNHKRIPQFAILPIVENAYKHGRVDPLAAPFSLSVEYRANRLEIACANKIGQQNKDEGSGVGLDNLRKRLELLYPNDYTLDVTADENNFTIKIIIPAK